MLEQANHAWQTPCSSSPFPAQLNPAQYIQYHASNTLHKNFSEAQMMALKIQTLPHNDKVFTLPELHSLLRRPHPTPHRSLA